nr:Uma2 family endonuclease [Spirulina subsalsa]
MLPNGDMRSPDVSFVSAARLKQSPRTFANLAPDLMVEVKSPTDSLVKTRAKIAAFLEAGTQVGILINPDNQTVEVYRPNGSVERLQAGDRLQVKELLPGWELPIVELWPLEFE